MNNRKRFIRDQGLNSIEVISGFAKARIELPNLPKEITKDEYSTLCARNLQGFTLFQKRCESL